MEFIIKVKYINFMNLKKYCGLDFPSSLIIINLDMMKIYKPINLVDFQFIADSWSEPKNNKFMFTHRITAQETKNRIKNKNSFTYIVEVDGERVGNLNLRKVPDDQSGRLGIIIDYRYQSKGYGKEAMKLLEKEAKKLGIKKLRLEVFVSNKVAVNLYKKMGYKEFERLIAMEKKVR